MNMPLNDSLKSNHYNDHSYKKADHRKNDGKYQKDDKKDMNTFSTILTASIPSATTVSTTTVATPDICICPAVRIIVATTASITATIWVINQNGLTIAAISA